MLHTHFQPFRLIFHFPIEDGSGSDDAVPSARPYLQPSRDGKRRRRRRRLKICCSHDLFLPTKKFEAWNLNFHNCVFRALIGQSRHSAAFELFSALREGRRRRRRRGKDLSECLMRFAASARKENTRKEWASRARSSYSPFYTRAGACLC